MGHYSDTDGTHSYVIEVINNFDKDTEVVFTVLPFYHIYGRCNILADGKDYIRISTGNKAASGWDIMTFD